MKPLEVIALIAGLAALGVGGYYIMSHRPQPPPGQVPQQNYVQPVVANYPGVNATTGLQGTVHDVAQDIGLGIGVVGDLIDIFKKLGD